jgi:AraC-like DNA-binding protein/mannose-6-phosphate isomerase-like protein (cupin superfamily)
MPTRTSPSTKLATHPVDVERAARASFGLAENQAAVSTDWHRHARHQVLFAAQGSMSLEVEGQRWLLPPQRAAFIAAQTRHRTRSSHGVLLRTVYLDPGSIAPPLIDCRVFVVTPLARAMFLEACRFGAEDAPGTAPDEALRSAFFTTLAYLVREWLTAEQPYALPTARTPELARALRWIDEHLADASMAGAARAAWVAERTLARRFEDETHMTFRSYLQAARMMRAMELLAVPGSSITDTAFAVGFASLPAFTTAFTQRCGETPSAYRSRSLDYAGAGAGGRTSSGDHFH